MIYQLKFMYHDDKDISVTLKEEELASFYQHLSNKTMYFGEGNKMGFWTDLDKVRYVQALQLAEPAKEEEKLQEPALVMELPDAEVVNS